MKSVVLNYSVDSVIDNRLISSNIIGILGSKKRKTEVLINGEGLAPSINTYIHKSYSLEPSSKNSYTLKINLLKCLSKQKSFLMTAELEYDFEFIDNKTNKTVLEIKSKLNCQRLIIFGSTFELLLKRALTGFLMKSNKIFNLPD